MMLWTHKQLTLILDSKFNKTYNINAKLPSSYPATADIMLTIFTCKHFLLLVAAEATKGVALLNSKNLQLQVPMI